MKKQIIAIALAAATLTGVTAIELNTTRYEKREIYEYDANQKALAQKYASKETPAPEEVDSLEELELPLRRLDYGEFRYDFDRLVAKGLRKEAKKIYEEQKKARELSQVEDIVLPISYCVEEAGNRFDESRCEVWRGRLDELSCWLRNSDDWSSKTVFYDALGRRISDSLAKDAFELYKKQEEQKEWDSWKRVNLRGFWDGFWGLLGFSVKIVIAVFAITFIIKKFLQAKKDGIGKKIKTNSFSKKKYSIEVLKKQGWKLEEIVKALGLTGDEIQQYLYGSD